MAHAHGPTLPPRTAQARLEALKGKYGTHVASNMKQKIASESANPPAAAPVALAAAR